MVIPIRDVNPVHRTPWVTYALIAANIAIFLLTPASAITVTGAASLAQTCQQQAFYDRYAAIPIEVVHNQPLALVPDGRTGVGDQGPGCVVARPNYHKNPMLSVLSSLFLHGSWLHLLGNMLFLWIFGNNIEDRFGRFRYLLFYLACGVVATYGFALTNPHSTEVLIGASGAIAGVLGAYLILYPRARVWSLVPVLLFLPLRLPAWLVLGLWFLLQWVYTAGYAISSAGSVAYPAHVLGFVSGALVALLMRGAQRSHGEGSAQ
ncbi:MAG: rhomboid family intramembrane serine protease [Pseudonocardiales bacterium]|nr:rhomboid family intramembrane serine protease [Actinomycetota bacterium]PZS24212.1 MAG: rhomboid family intramembrane serine protease [Pseudonocardiales bacterium]